MSPDECYQDGIYKFYLRWQYDDLTYKELIRIKNCPRIYIQKSVYPGKDIDPKISNLNSNKFNQILE